MSVSIDEEQRKLEEAVRSPNPRDEELAAHLEDLKINLDLLNSETQRDTCELMNYIIEMVNFLTYFDPSKALSILTNSEVKVHQKIGEKLYYSKCETHLLKGEHLLYEDDHSFVWAPFSLAAEDHTFDCKTLVSALSRPAESGNAFW